MTDPAADNNNSNNNNADTMVATKSAELSRVMVPADANVAGNVHGGTIMQMIEEAAGVAAYRFFNTADNNNNKNGDHHVKVLTARVESITFPSPLHVGDVAKVQARVVYSSDHTVAVAVKVLAERLSACQQDIVSNLALLWIVGHVHRNNAEATNPSSLSKNEHGIATVQRQGVNHQHVSVAKAPHLERPTDQEGRMAHKLAQLAYKKRKAHEAADPAELPDSLVSMDEHGKPRPSLTSQDSIETTGGGLSPDASQVELAQVMLPADCVNGVGLVRGGVVMKLMDNASGVVAVRHCGTNVVTVSVDAMDLVAPVLLGDVLRIQARPVFTSSKSIEIEVQVLAERFVSDRNTGKLERTEFPAVRQAYFTFVSLGKEAKALPMRPLLPQTEIEIQKFAQGKARYEQRKALRANKK